MPRRIAFLNPFGTDAYDEIITETLGPLALPTPSWWLPT